MVMMRIRKIIKAVNGWAVDHHSEVKRNREKYVSPIDFYIKNGFLADQDVRIENDKISVVKITWKKNRDI